MRLYFPFRCFLAFFITALASSPSTAGPINFDFSAESAGSDWESFRMARYTNCGIAGCIIQERPYGGAVVKQSEFDGNYLTTDRRSAIQRRGSYYNDYSIFTLKKNQNKPFMSGFKDEIVVDVKASKNVKTAYANIYTDNSALIRYGNIIDRVDIDGGWSQLRLGKTKVSEISHTPSASLELKLDYGRSWDLRQPSPQTAIDNILSEGNMVFAHGPVNSHVDIGDNSYLVGNKIEGFDQLWSSTSNLKSQVNAANASLIFGASETLSRFQNIETKPLSDTILEASKSTNAMHGFNIIADGTISALSTQLGNLLVPNTNGVVNVADETLKTLASSINSKETLMLMLGNGKTELAQSYIQSYNQKIASIEMSKSLGKIINLNMIESAYDDWVNAGVAANEAMQYYKATVGNEDKSIIDDFTSRLFSRFQEVGSDVLSTAIKNGDKRFKSTREAISLVKSVEKVSNFNADLESLREVVEAYRDSSRIEAKTDNPITSARNLKSRYSSGYIDLANSRGFLTDEAALEIFAANHITDFSREQISFGGEGVGSLLSDDPSIVSLVKGSPVWMDIALQAPSDEFYLSFDYNFLDPNQYLEVWLNEELLTSLTPSSSSLGFWLGESLEISDLFDDIFNLQFFSNGETGAEVLVRNVSLTPKVVFSEEALKVTEPNSLVILGLGLFSLVALRSRFRLKRIKFESLRGVILLKI